MLSGYDYTQNQGTAEHFISNVLAIDIVYMVSIKSQVMYKIEHITFSSLYIFLTAKPE